MAVDLVVMTVSEDAVSDYSVQNFGSESREGPRHSDLGGGLIDVEREGGRTSGTRL